MLKFLRSATLVLLILAAFAFRPGTAAAANYGTDGYGKCVYSTGCPQHTVVTTPSGLKIAVNLVDGQQISSSDGYDIIVTPLNGSGSSFHKVDIYIDGKLVTTVEPAENGTATWHWDPTVYPGTVVKVVATDQDGKTVSKEFTVVVKTQPRQSDNTSGGGETPSKESSAGILQPFYTLAASFVKSAKTIIKNLPKPVVVAFPYLLFIVILAEILLLIFQTKRELSELRTLQLLLAKEREVSDLKQGFLQLISHYLRTPLTILKSGAEGLPRDGVAANVVAGIQQAATNLSQTIEDIIGTIETGSSTAVVAGSAAQINKHQVRQKIVVWLPVAFVGLFAALFVYLANSVTEFDASVISIIIQVLLYIILASVVYQVWRRLRLHRQDGQNAKTVLAEASAVQAARDQVIHQAASKLQEHITQLGASVSAIPATATNARFVTKGLSQLKTVQNEFLIASKLQGARSSAPYQTTSLSAIFEPAANGVAEAAQKKNVSVKLAGDASISTQSTGLATLVLQTLLDNAVAYSSDGGSVEVSMQTEGTASVTLVSDHGQGIPTEKLQSLFQPFSKAEGAEVFTHEGMGFSLYLDKLIMTYLGGDIAIQSKPSEGTQVSLFWNVG